ncbi:DUF4190 domain-containing protein [Oerskovia sp. Root22]|uniref:DUF4190 domain-containing protein n=1 Tax=Oerskovia sp. Root22 TaxID=1736494 RepID=UPI0006F85570|nr:DUF4190 domain-containing protein [Oerskovia sp. Root22]KRC42539.1 hypothetical protein ASE15_00230 [Oerskovia sp. Root22]
MSYPEQPEQNPSGQPNPYAGGPQDPAAGQAPQAPQAPQYGAPQAPQYGAPAPGVPQAPYGAGAPQAPYTPGGVPGAPAQDPGKTLGIVGLVLSIIGCTSLIGLILSIVALNKSKKAGYKNGIALAGIIVGAVLLVGSIIALAAFGGLIGEVLEKCADLGPGTHYVDGVEYTCS